MTDEEKAEILKSTEKLWNERNRLKDLEKENAELKAQNEKYKTEKNYYDNLCHNKTVECDDLRKGIKQFQSDNDKFIKKIEEIAEENEELKAQIEKMKCCQNCKHKFEPREKGGYVMPCEATEYKPCDKWEIAE